MRISAVRQLATTQDSVVIDGLTLGFRSGPADSIRVDLEFP